MRALLIPGYGGNPYLSELAEALDAQGVEVHGVGGLGPQSLRERTALFARHDVVHVHWTHGYLDDRSRLRRTRKAAAFLAAVAVARVRGTRFVWTIHNVFAHRNPDVPLERAFNRALVGLASGCVVHCAAAAEEVAAAYRLGAKARGKIAVIPHGHYAGSYPSGVSRARAREGLGLPESARVFVHLGQIRAYKGIDALLDAFERLDDPGTRLVIAGKPKSNGYARRIEERAAATPGITTFLERVPDDAVQTYMAAADAVVLPYERILTSGTTVLAMSFGRAVVTPDLGCAREMLASQPELLYDAGDRRALEGALRRALTADLDAYGEANRAAALAVGWDGVGARTAAVYRAALGGPISGM